MDRWRLLMTGWIVTLVALLATPAAAAPPGVVLDVCVLSARPAMTASALFARPDAFDCAVTQRSLGSGDFWVLGQPLPWTVRGWPYSVRFASLWRSHTTMYTLFADGSIRRSGFASRTAAPHLRIGAIVDVPLPMGETPPVRLLWHIEGAANIRGILLDPVLIPQTEAARRDASLVALYAAFFGMAAGLLIYNLSLWAALRQSFQPAYCLLLACMIGYAATSSAIVVEWMPTLAGNDRLRWSSLFLGGAAASVMMFARLFFEPRVFDRSLRRANAIVIGAMFGSTLLFAIAAPWNIRLLDGFVTFAFVAMMLTVPWILVRAWRLRSDYLWIFAIAWAAPIIACCGRLVAALGFVRWGGWVEHSTVAAMTAETLLSSIGIAYRIRALGRERDKAREREMLARSLADIDGLTGLLNRRAFLRQAIGRSGPQTLLIADLDHFKRINETIGHDGGDEVLRAVARVLVATAPAGALVARMGGEEFAIVTDAAANLAPARILTRLREARMPYDLAVTASVGTCTGALSREADWKTLYREADRALYAAKAAGRDRARDGSLSIDVC